MRRFFSRIKKSDSLCCMVVTLLQTGDLTLSIIFNIFKYFNNNKLHRSRAKLKVVVFLEWALVQAAVIPIYNNNEFSAMTFHTLEPKRCRIDCYSNAQRISFIDR